MKFKFDIDSQSDFLFFGLNGIASQISPDLSLRFLTATPTKTNAYEGSSYKNYGTISSGSKGV